MFALVGTLISRQHEVRRKLMTGIQQAGPRFVSRNQEDQIAQSANKDGLPPESELFGESHSLALPIGKQSGFFHDLSIYPKYIFVKGANQLI